MAANFGELVLILGDHHMPSRSVSIPEKFRQMLVNGKMQRVICTGNVGSAEERDRLRDLVGGAAGSVHCVAGDYDFAPGGGAGPAEGAAAAAAASLPQSRVVRLGQFRVGVIGGHQAVPWGDLGALAMAKRRLNVDVLVCGGRRKEGVVEHEGGYYIFPGSITGSYSAGTSNTNPSFILLAVQGHKVVCYVYEMKGGEVDVSKTEFSKQ